MGCSGSQIPLMQVVRFDSHLQQPFIECRHGFQGIIDPSQQHRLIHQRNPRLQQSAACRRCSRSELGRVGKVDADPYRFDFLQHSHQDRGHPLRKHGGHLGPDADQTDVRNGP